MLHIQEAGSYWVVSMFLFNGLTAFDYDTFIDHTNYILYCYERL